MGSGVVYYLLVDAILLLGVLFERRDLNMDKG
jgi:hypothetical protein